MQYLISPEKKQYKANLHCHSTYSDGKKTPEELKEMYQRHGYSILCISDHEYPMEHTALTDENFLMLTGYEVYIRPAADGKYDPYEREIHFNLFARDPKNEALVCYDPRYSRYMTEERLSQLSLVGPKKPREYSVSYVNEFVRVAKENGYIAAYNHPWWSLEDEETILAYEGFFSMEMSNYSSWILGAVEYNAPLYDKMLRAGKRIFCHSADDNHNHHAAGEPNCDSFGGFAMIMPDEFSYDGVFQAMEQGEMYSSMGPEIFEVSVHKGRLHVESSPVSRISVFTGSKKPKTAFAPVGETITSADLDIDERAKFIRISVTDLYGHHADTRGYLRSEFEE